MSNSTLDRRSAIAFLLMACLLAGCGGTRVLKESQPIQTTRPLAATSDQRVTVSLDWVIVRDGPGTWAMNADWDEYLLSVNNQSGQPIQVTRLIVTDSLGASVESQPGRKQLVQSSRKTTKRYKESGLRVKAGGGTGAMLASGAAVTAAGLLTAAASTAGIGGVGVGAAGAAGGLLLLGPALAVGGVVRGVNNSKVNKQIELRQTLLPLKVPSGEELGLDVFFPLAPSPRMVELVYTDATGEHRLVIDTSTALDGLHFDARED